MPNPKKPCPCCLQCGVEVKRHNYQFCSNKCQQTYQYQQYIIRWLAGFETGTRGKEFQQLSDHVRRYMLEQAKQACQRCGWSVVNPFSGEVPLQIHHVDGNNLNNVYENLEVLCPNCHALTETYGSLNRGKYVGKKRRR